MRFRMDPRAKLYLLLLANLMLFFHAARQEVEENADQFLRGDGAAIGGKADFHVDDKTAVGRI